MRGVFKFIFRCFLLAGVFGAFFLWGREVRANTCSGSVSYQWKDYTCEIDPITGGKFCGSPRNHDATSDCGQL